MQQLVGTTVRAVFMDKDTQHYILFRTNLGDFVFVASGDCCSESWFSAVNGLSALIDNKVTQAVEVDMGDVDDGRSRQEYDTLYRITLVTNRGACDIEFRNSSNGYYGGCVSDYGNSAPSDVTMERIEKDYTT